MLPLSERITILEKKVNQLAIRLKENFNAEGLVEVKEGNNSSENLDLRLKKLCELFSRSAEVISETNSPYCSLIDLSSDIYIMPGEFELVIDLLENQIHEFQESINTATAIEFEDKKKYSIDKLNFLLKIGVDQEYINILLFKQFDDGKKDMPEGVEMLLNRIISIGF